MRGRLVHCMICCGTVIRYGSHAISLARDERGLACIPLTNYFKEQQNLSLHFTKKTMKEFFVSPPFAILYNLCQ